MYSGWLHLLWPAGVLALLLYFLWKSTYWWRKGYRGPFGYPLVGNMLPYFIGREHYGDVYQRIYNKYPKLSWIGITRLFNEPAIVVRDQQLVKDIMIRNFNCLQDNILWIDPIRDPIIVYNPFVAKGEKWRQMRNEIMPIFTPNKVKSSFPHILNVCQKLNSYVQDNLKENCFEVKNLFSKFTMDVIASAAFGIDGDSFTNANSDFTRLVERLFLPHNLSLLETTALLFSPLLGRLMGYRYMPKELQKWLSSIIHCILDSKEREVRTEEGKNSKSSNFVQWLLENRRKAHIPINREIIIGHCSTFLLEGFETSSSLMAFALYQYAINPDKQEKVLDEVDNILAKYNGELCYEAVQEMTYLEASLYETLRLHAAMFALLKECTRPFLLAPQSPGKAEYLVPAGMVFVIPVKAIHYDPNLHPEPNAFKPERFLSDRPISTKQSCGFLGFGEGPRMCPGNRFGLAQSKSGLVTILSQFSVKLHSKMQGNLLQISTTTFLTSPRNGIWLNFHPRRREVD